MTKSFLGTTSRAASGKMKKCDAVKTGRKKAHDPPKSACKRYGDTNRPPENKRLVFGRAVRITGKGGIRGASPLSLT